MQNHYFSQFLAFTVELFLYCTLAACPVAVLSIDGESPGVRVQVNFVEILSRRQVRFY